MKLSEITAGGDYLVQEGSTPTAGSVPFSSFYRFRVTELQQRRSYGGRKTWRVVGFKCRKDGTPLLIADATGEPVMSDFAPRMVLKRWEEE